MALEPTGLAPRLLFAIEHETATDLSPSEVNASDLSAGAPARVLDLGLSYRPGLTLLQMKERLDARTAEKIGAALEARVLELHERTGRVHGDLSPRNILVHERDGDFEVTLVDWEFSTTFRRLMTEDFENQGTAGFSLGSSGLSPHEREIVALGKCLEFLGGARSESNKRRRTGWFSWT